MKRTIPIIAIMLLTGTLLSNCSCKHLCDSPTPMAGFVNFDSAALNVVVVKQYNNNGQFTDLEHTRVYTSRAFTGTNLSDTAHLDSAGIMLDFTSDYEIAVPAAGRTFRLKKIEVVYMKSADACTSGLEYYLNDTMHTIRPVFTPALSATIELNR